MKNGTALRNVGMLLAVCTLSMATPTCSSNSGSHDAAPHDLVSLDFSFGDLPPGCPPGAGNEKGIGAPCTPTGNECAAKGLLCSCSVFLGIQPPPDTPCFCSNLSFATCAMALAHDASYCGAGATCCGYMDQGSLCVPNACLDSMTCPVF